MKQFLLSSVALLGLAWGVPALPAESLKIGFVDLQRALNESETGKKAKEKFKSEVDRMQANLEKKKGDVERLKEDLEKKGMLLREEERRNLEKDYRQKLREFERSYKDAQSDLQLRDNELTGEILKEIHGVIQKVGEREGYILILEGNNTVVLYGAPGIDLTEEIIKVYNGQGRNGGKGSGIP